MNVTLTPDLERALVQRARLHGTTPEAVVLDAIRDKLGPDPAELAKILQPRDEWEGCIPILHTTASTKWFLR